MLFLYLSVWSLYAENIFTLAGPSLTETLTVGHVSQVCQRLDIPKNRVLILKQYSATLPVLDVKSSFPHYLVCLGIELFKKAAFSACISPRAATWNVGSIQEIRKLPLITMGITLHFV